MDVGQRPTTASNPKPASKRNPLNEMTPDRMQEIEAAIIRAMATFGVDASKPYQKMGLIGLYEMRRDIPRNEFLSVLKSMEGVVLDFDVSPAEVRIPTSFF